MSDDFGMCPIDFLGELGGIFTYSCQVCSGQCPTEERSDDRPHTIDFDCEHCGGPCGGCTDGFPAFSPAQRSRSPDEPSHECHLGHLGLADFYDPNNRTHALKLGLNSKLELQKTIIYQDLLTKEHRLAVVFRINSAFKFKRNDFERTVRIGVEVPLGSMIEQEQGIHQSTNQHCHLIFVPRLQESFHIATVRS